MFLQGQHTEAVVHWERNNAAHGRPAAEPGKQCVSLPPGAAFEVTKRSWRAAEAWHSVAGSGSPWTTGEGAASVASEAPRCKASQRDLDPL